jgi:phosphoribosylformylglycinamidine synthase
MTDEMTTYAHFVRCPLDQFPSPPVPQSPRGTSFGAGGFLRGVPQWDFLRGVPQGDFLRGVPQGDFLRGVPQGDFLRGVPQGDFLRGAGRSVRLGRPGVH